MLIDARTRPDGGPAEAGLRRWEDGRLAVAWKGHLFLPGRRAGEESVAALADLLREAPLQAVAGRLGGVFGLLVHDKAAATWRAAVDNAGMYKLFRDDAGRISTSFLGLLAARGARARDLAPDRLVEYLAHGAVYGARTPVPGVDKLRGDEVLELAASGGAGRILRKDLDASAGGGTGVVLDRFRDLAVSLEGRRLSVDVTGGFDTRLIACLLHHHGLPFEAAISGREDADDVRIAREAARVLDRPFALSGHDISRLDEELPLTFRDGDGLTDPRRFHRDRQNALSRLARGVEVMSHGGGGAQFKDFFCYQDFPFYGSRKVRFGRYYDLRITPVTLPAHYFTASGAELAAVVRPRTLESFEPYRAATNNESYDRVAYHLRAPEFYGQYFANYVNMGLDVAAPLLDHASVRAAIGLSPWARFFNGWHRRLITRHCRDLAALPTTEGYTASSAPRDLAANFLGFAGTQALRVAKKTGQRVAGRAMFLPMGAATVDVEGFLDLLRGTRAFADALARLKALGLLAPDLAPAAVRDIHVGRVLGLGLLARHLEG